MSTLRSLNVLKKLDLFQQPISFRTTRNKSKKDTLYYGSWFGVFLSFIGLCILLSFATYLLIQMHQHLLDKTESQTTVNRFT